MGAAAGDIWAGCMLGADTGNRTVRTSSMPTTLGNSDGCWPGPDSSSQILNHLQMTLSPVLQLFPPVVCHHCLHPLCGCHFGHHLGEFLRLLARSWVCPVPPPPHPRIRRDCGRLLNLVYVYLCPSQDCAKVPPLPKKKNLV